MSNRVERKRGRYVAEPESPYPGGHFEIATVPAPPDATFVPASDGPFGRRQAHFIVAMACNHCLKNIEIVFPVEDRTIVVSERMLRDLADSAMNESRRVRRELEKRYERVIEPNLVVGRQLDAMEEWYGDV